MPVDRRPFITSHPEYPEVHLDVVPQEKVEIHMWCRALARSPDLCDACDSRGVESLHVGFKISDLNAELVGQELLDIGLWLDADEVVDERPKAALTTA